jgi:hypothetical protein
MTVVYCNEWEDGRWVMEDGLWAIGWIVKMTPPS